MTPISIDYWFLRRNGIDYKTVLRVLAIVYDPNIAYKDENIALMKK